MWRPWKAASQLAFTLRLIHATEWLQEAIVLRCSTNTFLHHLQSALLQMRAGDASVNRLLVRDMANCYAEQRMPCDFVSSFRRTMDAVFKHIGLSRLFFGSIASTMTTPVCGQRMHEAAQEFVDLLLPTNTQTQPLVPVSTALARFFAPRHRTHYQCRPCRKTHESATLQRSVTRLPHQLWLHFETALPAELVEKRIDLRLMCSVAALKTWRHMRRRPLALSTPTVFYGDLWYLVLDYAWAGECQYKLCGQYPEPAVAAAYRIHAVEFAAYTLTDWADAETE